MPIDHFSFMVPQPKLDPLISFLTTSLAHMGFKEMMRPMDNVVGLGEQVPYFWLTGCVPGDVQEESLMKVLRGLHVAFRAESKCGFGNPLSNAIQGIWWLTGAENRCRAGEAVPCCGVEGWCHL
jgi:hypothetical protein